MKVCIQQLQGKRFIDTVLKIVSVNVLSDYLYVKAMIKKHYGTQFRKYIVVVLLEPVDYVVMFSPYYCLKKRSMPIIPLKGTAQKVKPDLRTYV